MTLQFHHSSFLAGRPVASAGHIVIENGILRAINALTGHYKIDPSLNKQLLEELKLRGVDISKVTDHKLNIIPIN
ncbi:MAG: hypothetical protein HC880_06690 [Bacteroidia bacterium]|nr:hypothetical protein [Bacteroidia bacterium]